MTTVIRFPRHPFLKLSIIFSAALFIYLFALPAHASAQVKRVVIIKVDGLPNDMVDRFVQERNPQTGKSQLPWISHVFYEEGTRIANFYVRGMSLSGPSWSLLDTGQHLQIKGNVEYDRYTLHSYDYLNFIPFYIANVAKRRIDMPGVELLDELGVPLLLDAYPYDERYNGFQLYQRGNRWTTLGRALPNRFNKPPRELLDEWTIGLEGRSIVMDQLERELIEKLSDPSIRYLDYYTTEFDHAAHHNRDREAHLYALQELDAIVGRIYTAVEKSPLAAETAVILVSDHGVNTDERIYCQGYNLVKLLGSAAGGGHHVVTKRRLMLDYAIKGMYPLVPLVTTTTPDSFYLKGQSTDYPTALLDFDGNERASFHLRDSDLNLLHILLKQLQQRQTPAPLRRALTDAFFQTLDKRRAEWSTELSQLNEELVALHKEIEKQRTVVLAQPKKWTKADQDAGRDKEAIRQFARMDSAMSDERDYTIYTATLARLLALKRET
ncbi:MAG TPA: alkaline phosphatase family protein, partial [Pyrinomonadaceae bacterium]